MKLSFVIQEEILLRDFIKLHDISDKALAAIKNEGDLVVNGNHVTVRYPLQPNDHLDIIFPKEKKGKQLEPYDYPLDILYEDEYLLIVNKPAGMPCIPDHRYHNQTLANVLVSYYLKIGLESTIHFVNRLDRETSGLLVVAKYRYIHHLFSKVDIQRKYLALVHGKMKDQTIDLPIYRKGNSVKRCIDPLGKPSITHCRVIKEGKQWTWMECLLETGRTHQIRVHLSAIGHPLVGDSLYGYEQDVLESYFLHSYDISFIHPISSKKIHLTKQRKKLA